jgi:hypothetical protein
MLTLYGTIKLLSSNAQHIGCGIFKYEVNDPNDARKMLRYLARNPVRIKLEGASVRKRTVTYVDPGACYETFEDAKKNCCDPLVELECRKVEDAVFNRTSYEVKQLVKKTP